ncbi:MAG: hypothetical protein A2Y89_03975 [Chloroflexi bacterium RBG_13_51_18]|nr:MAG: hypothetical protein A2Y89_03975 [Chloroflexi bacterium RBG_13_51_18]
MGFFSFIKKLFTSESVDEAALDAARARHGIHIDDKQKAEMDESTTEEQRFAENYDAWEELGKMRSNFFFGSWVTRKFRPIGEEKLKKQLEDLEKKRRDEAEKKHKGEGV